MAISLDELTAELDPGSARQTRVSTQLHFRVGRQAPATRARSAVIRSATFSRSSGVGQSPLTTTF